MIHSLDPLLAPPDSDQTPRPAAETFKKLGDVGGIQMAEQAWLARHGPLALAGWFGKKSLEMDDDFRKAPEKKGDFMGNHVKHLDDHVK